jgi:uncharacterized membrane protein
MKADRQRVIDSTFVFGILLKAIGASIELISAIVVIVLSPETFFHLTEPLKHLGIHVSESLANTARVSTFWYLLTHGVIRLGLAVALLREILWAYPVAIILLLTSTAYQLYILRHSLGLGAGLLVAFNLLILALTVYEYRNIKSGHHLQRPHLSDVRRGGNE